MILQLEFMRRLERLLGDYMDDIIEFIKDNNIGKYEVDVNLKKHCTYRVGGNCKVMVSPKDTKKCSGLFLSKPASSKDFFRISK